MSNTASRRGQCLCGAVRVIAHEASNEVGACHCKTCRRWGGGPFMELNCGTRLDFEGHENIATFASSSWAERGFCKRCGTHLFYRLRDSGQSMVPVGLFDSDEKLVFRNQVFIDEKPAFYSFKQRTHDMTGAQLFAKFVPPE